MFILGHAGISAGVVHSLDRRADLRWAPFFGLLPDLIDKPLALLAPGFANGWTHTIGHSLLGFAVLSIGALAVAPRRALVAIVPYALHFVLDRMWMLEDRPALLWPFAGVDMPPHTPPFPHWWYRFYEPWQAGGELLGLAIVVALALRARLWREESRRRFLAEGILTAERGAAS